MTKQLLLKNLRVLNTRPVHLAEKTSEQIIKAGGEVVLFPLLAIEPNTSNWTEQLPKLSTFKHAIFISSNAVTYFFKQVPSHLWPTHIKTYALGKGTQQALKENNIQHVKRAASAHSEALLTHPDLQAIQNDSILIIKGNDGRTLLHEQLTARGATLTAIEVYQRVLPKPPPDLSTTLFHENAVDIILITSETALKHLFILFTRDNPKASDWLQHKTCWVISNRLAAAAKQYGFKKIIMSPL